MPNAAIKPHGLSEDDAISARPSGRDIQEETLASDLRGQLHIVQNSTPAFPPAPEPEIGRRSVEVNAPGDPQTPVHRLVPQSPGHECLMNARQVAKRLRRESTAVM